MKQRVTYVQPAGTGIDLNSIHVNPDSLVFSNSHNAALEKRVTVGLSELPEELTTILNDCHELHIRWASPDHYELSSPLVSRLPPGLHVFYTPRKADKEADVCTLLHTLFGEELKCHSVAESFSRPPILSERFTSSSSYQYFHVLPHLTALKNYLAKRICPTDLKVQLACETETDAIDFAASLDIDFDTISHAVSMTATWSPDASAGNRPGSGITSRAIIKLRENDGIEVGILQGEKADEVEELSVGGYLTIIGEQDRPSATMFSFPSRHHPLPVSSGQSFNATFETPTGLHPKLTLIFPSASLTPPQPSCALHAYLTLPSALFIDRYQFSDPLFLESQHLVALHSLSGETDLEAPDWVIKTWGSAALFELAHPKPSDLPQSSAWTITIPTHLRYVKPSVNASSSSHVDLEIPIPALFWACRADAALKFRTNPFDRVDLGYDGLFGPKTMFYHIPPTPAASHSPDLREQDLLLDLKAPVLDPSGAGWVQPATIAVVVLGFAWVLWKFFNGTAGSSDAKTKRDAKKTQ